jgi:hypothetical protein
MHPTLAGKMSLLLVCCTLVALPVGCLGIRGILPGAEPFRYAEYPLAFKDGPKKSKEIVVALFVSSDPKLGQEFAPCANTLASEMAKKFPELAKENKQQIAVIDPVLVKKFAIKTPNWERMHPSEWGRSLGADYIIMIQLDRMSLYLPGTQNQIYEGNAVVTGDVFDVDAGPTQPKYRYVYEFKYPTTGKVESSSVPAHRFKREFLEELAVELCSLHFDHK